ncbi:MAG: MotA/TolQ/ExbB proton channel family protein [Acidobacteriota bacterium]
MIEFLRAGGPVMFPLLGCSVLALAIIVERLINLRESKALPPNEVEHLKTLIEGGLLEQAEDYCSRRPGPLNNIVAAALACREESREMIRQVVNDQGRQEVPQLERYLGVLGTIVSISPLLGLLGTVTGMIQVFQVVSAQGVGQAGALAEGIAEALITTATGLTIAIPALAAYNYFAGKAEALVLGMERLALEFLKKIVGQQEGFLLAEPRPMPVEGERGR